MGAGVETLRAISSVEEKRLVVLYHRKLIPQPLNLTTQNASESSWQVSRGACTSEGVTIGGRVAILPRTLDSMHHVSHLIRRARERNVLGELLLVGIVDILVEDMVVEERDAG